jgi:hypothetical protein
MQSRCCLARKSQQKKNWVEKLRPTKPVILGRLFGPVAQWIEQRFPKPCVGSSILLGATYAA